MTRQERRALERKERKLARKAERSSLVAEQRATIETQAAAPPVTLPSGDIIPEPGFPFAPLSQMTPPPVPPGPAGSFNADMPKVQGHKAISDAQLAANRANAQLSTGPRSQTGQAISAQNRTTHGLARHNGEFQLLPNEKPEAFASLKSALEAEHQPQTETESILINTMAESQWLADRAETLQTTCFDKATGLVNDPKMFSLYMRYHSAHSRAFNKSLKDLLTLRKEKRAVENGFEAQKQREAALALEKDRLEMKKQAHYWNIALKDAQTCNQLGANLVQQQKAALEDLNFDAKYAAELAQRGLKSNPWGAAVGA